MTLMLIWAKQVRVWSATSHFCPVLSLCSHEAKQYVTTHFLSETYISFLLEDEDQVFFCYLLSSLPPGDIRRGLTHHSPEVREIFLISRLRSPLGHAIHSEHEESGWAGEVHCRWQVVTKPPDIGVHYLWLPFMFFLYLIFSDVVKCLVR